jgi:hypothetical protein
MEMEIPMKKHVWTVVFVASVTLALTACKKKEGDDAVTAGKPEEMAEAQRDVREQAQEARQDATELRQDAREEQKDVAEERKDVIDAQKEAADKTREAGQLDRVAAQVTGVNECDEYIEKFRKCEKISATDRQSFDAFIANQRNVIQQNADGARERVTEACEQIDDSWDKTLKAANCD